ncbi:Phosphoesterase PHP, N-terminal precursor [Rhodovulum sp. P5]|uniref:CehA/McbA family metallohydrolase n=1 Tax=Rhodovulum sp. P5 TaxID=1564506 RepID=UPI0009C3DB08|nr:CehA/McbA family metallohydrolase [Rhodovulum sp. P5]ARE39207.1 Phosphoesterase PHP, N-terminal precursor [Rhodovulum sp. P5]
MLDAFSAPGQFWRGNLHGHSTMSDGRIGPEEACAAYRDAGYDFTCLTDHFRPKYDYPVTDTRPFRSEGFTTILGAELHAPETSRGVDWHILAVGLPPDFARPTETESGPQLARRARAAGAFVAIAHPHWYQLQPEDGVALDAAQAVEVYNHTSFVHTDRGDGAVFLDTMLSRGLRLNAIAVDDSHWKNGDAFGGWVMVKSKTLDPDALLAALHDGHYYASQGPEIHAITREGDEIAISCSPASAIILVGDVSESARAHGTNLTRARLPLERFKGGWCRAVLVDALGRRAWSNPLWP